MKNKKVFYLLIAVTAFLLYSNSINSPFQYDDKHVILWNREVKDIGNLPAIILNTYRPILRATFLANYYLFGENPAGYHVSNILIHIINCILVFFLMELLFKNRGASILAGLLFLAHPVNTQAVNYISARSTALCLTFYFLGIIFFVKGISGKRPGLYYAGMLGSFIMALGVKEVAVSMPVMFFGYYYVFVKRELGPFLKKYAVFILLLGAYLLYRYLSSGTIGDYSTQRDLLTTVLTNIKANVFGNMRLLVFPVNLSVAYEFPEVSSFSPAVLVSALVLIALVTIAFKTKVKYLSFSIFWFFITLLPTQSLVAREEIICEHRLYLASFGICMLFAMGIAEMAKTTKRKQVIAAACAMLLIFGIKTYDRNLDWQSEVSLWKNMADKFPGSYKAHSNLGNSYAEKGKYREAAQQYRIIIEKNPEDAKMNNNLANLYYLTGEYDRAIESYRKAIRAAPGYLTAYNNLALAYERKGMFDDAITVYAGMLEKSPGNSQVYFKLGNVYQDKKLYNKAIELYLKSIAIMPEAIVYNNLGNAYHYTGLFRKALESYRNALALDGGLTEARNNMQLAIKNLEKNGEVKGE